MLVYCGGSPTPCIVQQPGTSTTAVVRTEPPGRSSRLKSHAPSSDTTSPAPRRNVVIGRRLSATASGLVHQRVATNTSSATAAASHAVVNLIRLAPLSVEAWSAGSARYSPLEANRLRPDALRQVVVTASPRARCCRPRRAAANTCQTTLAGGDGDHPAGDPALARQTDGVQPLPRPLVHPGGDHHGEHPRARRRATTCSPVRGLTPPSASVAPITARSSAVTSSEHCRV